LEGGRKKVCGSSRKEKLINKLLEGGRKKNLGAGEQLGTAITAGRASGKEKKVRKNKSG